MADRLSGAGPQLTVAAALPGVALTTVGAPGGLGGTAGGSSCCTTTGGGFGCSVCGGFCSWVGGVGCSVCGFGVPVGFSGSRPPAGLAVLPSPPSSLMGTSVKPPSLSTTTTCSPSAPST